MKLKTIIAATFVALLLAQVVEAQAVTIAFSPTTPVSRTTTSPILCELTLSGYLFDSTLLGANCTITGRPSPEVARLPRTRNA
jgi:hypothetical protein